MKPKRVMVVQSKGIQIKCTFLKYGKFVGSLFLRSFGPCKITCHFASSGSHFHEVRAHSFYFYNSDLTHILHCKNRLVVLTGEWLPWLHGLFWYNGPIV